MNNEKKPKSWMDRNFGKLMAVLIVILMMSVVLYVAFSQTQTDRPDDNDNQWNNDWTLYTMQNCPACIEQKNTLGVYINHINLSIVTCDESQFNYNLCKSKDIKVVPTWINYGTGQRIEGYQTLEAIEVMLNG